MICSKKSNTGFPIEQKVSIFQIMLEDIASILLDKTNPCTQYNIIFDILGNK